MDTTSSHSKVGSEFHSKIYRFVKFWSILYNSQQMHSINLPSDLDAKSRTTIMSYLGSGFDIADHHIPTLGWL